MFYAVKNGNKEIIQLLLSNPNIDVNKVNIFKVNILITLNESVKDLIILEYTLSMEFIILDYNIYFNKVMGLFHF